ncbi:MAG: hypothetical protein M3P24_10900, partial [Gemmatimonadota bacterium]|nr:hypothetical protein [Gemmatimonadota bacterium]
AYLSVSLPDSTPVRVPAGVLYRVEATGGNIVVTRPAGTAAPLRVEISGTELRARFVHPEPWTARVDLGPLLARVSASRITGCDDTGGRPATELTPEEARFPLMGPEGRPRGELILTQATLRRPERPRGGLVLEHVNGMVVLRE